MSDRTLFPVMQPPTSPCSDWGRRLSSPGRGTPN